MSRRSFSRIVLRKKGLGNHDRRQLRNMYVLWLWERTKGLLREKDELTDSRYLGVVTWEGNRVVKRRSMSRELRVELWGIENWVVELLWVVSYVRDFEWPSVYGSDSISPFIGKLRIICPPRAVNLTTQRLGKIPGITPGREDTMDR